MGVVANRILGKVACVSPPRVAFALFHVFLPQTLTMARVTIDVLDSQNLPRRYILEIAIVNTSAQTAFAPEQNFCNSRRLV